jgi:hypothetical protein
MTQETHYGVSVLETGIGISLRAGWLFLGQGIAEFLKNSWRVI